MTPGRRTPQVIGHLWRCTYEYPVCTVLMSSAANKIRIMCRLFAYADSSARCLGRSSASTKYSAGKYLRQVDATEVPRKAEEGRTRQTAEEITTLGRES